MKRVIDGKLYDTDKATCIASAESSCCKSDFGWWEEELYVTDKGRFFIAGEGHANSRWAEPCGNMRGPGSGMIAMTKNEALEWCEQHRIAADTVSKHFEIEPA